ncbi:hypothetical protein BLA29_012847, partial [Euroglyphus maynei]
MAVVVHDFFGDPIDDNNGISSRIKQSTTANNTGKSGKPFQKRSSFTSSERDHPHHHHLSSFPSVDGSTLDAERDLFGGRSQQSTSTTTTNANAVSSYGDLFSRNSSSTTTPKGLNSRDRYRGDHRGGNDENSANSTKTMDNSKFSNYSSK